MHTMHAQLCHACACTAYDGLRLRVCEAMHAHLLQCVMQLFRVDVAVSVMIQSLKHFLRGRM